MIKIIKVVFIVGLLVGCGNSLFGQQQTQVAPSSAGNRLANTQWRLVSLGASGSESPVVEGTTITLKLGPGLRVAGSAGCNSYGGEYFERGDTLSFSKIFSTKRACLAQRANQQEQLYLAALESSNRFDLSNDSLTIFYKDGRSVLNFAKDPPSGRPTSQSNDQCSPVTVLADFYSAVNAKEYDRAFQYWETPPQSLPDFSRGYAGTATVQLIVQPPMQYSGAAGSLYADIPTMLVARQRNGGERMFIGCYVTRKSNLSPPDVPKDEGWRIYRANMSQVSAGAKIQRLLAAACLK